MYLSGQKNRIGKEKKRSRLSASNLDLDPSKHNQKFLSASVEQNQALELQRAMAFERYVQYAASKACNTSTSSSVWH